MSKEMDDDIDSTMDGHNPYHVEFECSVVGYKFDSEDKHLPYVEMSSCEDPEMVFICLTDGDGNSSAAKFNAGAVKKMLSHFTDIENRW